MSAEDRSRLDGQWAVVTGGSKGIGFGIAEQLVSRGAHVVIVARNPDDLDLACSRLKERAGDSQKIETLVADIGDADDLERLFGELRERLPALNIFVANAGTGGLTKFVDLPIAEWDRIMQVNLRGTFIGCQAAARMMIDKPQANQAIVVVSSIRAQMFKPGTLAYASTKAALNQFVRGVALELASERIRVNAVSPGMTVTPLMLEGTPNVEEIAAANIPFGRAGRPIDVGYAAAFLASAEAGFITGANLIVDGGESLR